MESTGRKKCMCEKFMLDKSAPYKGFGEGVNTI
jgi:hypothetical protein